MATHKTRIESDAEASIPSIPPRVAVGDSWDDLEAKAEKDQRPPRVVVGDAWGDLEAKAEKEKWEAQFRVLMCILLFAITIFTVLVFQAMWTGDGQHINKAWELASLMICTALGWAAGKQTT